MITAVAAGHGPDLTRSIQQWLGASRLRWPERFRLDLLRRSIHRHRQHGTNPSVGGTAAGTATVTGTGGDGVRCRTSAPSGSTIMVLAEGTKVTTRGAASNGWTPVVCGGQNGFVSSTYLTLGSGTGTNPTLTQLRIRVAEPALVTSRSPAPVAADSTAASAASMTGMVITSAAVGSTLAVRGAATNGWQPVTCGGKAGYVSASYVTATTDPGNGIHGS